MTNLIGSFLFFNVYIDNLSKKKIDKIKLIVNLIVT